MIWALSYSIFVMIYVHRTVGKCSRGYLLALIIQTIMVICSLLKIWSKWIAEVLVSLWCLQSQPRESLWRLLLESECWTCGCHHQQTHWRHPSTHAEGDTLRGACTNRQSGSLPLSVSLFVSHEWHDWGKTSDFIWRDLDRLKIEA